MYHKLILRSFLKLIFISTPNYIYRCLKSTLQPILNRIHPSNFHMHFKLVLGEFLKFLAYFTTNYTVVAISKRTPFRLWQFHLFGLEDLYAIFWQAIAPKLIKMQTSALIRIMPNISGTYPKSSSQVPLVWTHKRAAQGTSKTLCIFEYSHF